MQTKVESKSQHVVWKKKKAGCKKKKASADCIGPSVHERFSLCMQYMMCSTQFGPSPAGPSSSLEETL